MEVIEKGVSDEEWVESFMQENWRSTILVSRGVIHNTLDQPALIAKKGDENVGLLVYRKLDDEQIEILSIDATLQFQGIGTRLLNKLKEIAEQSGVKRIWLITTNDNLDALRFYQRRGFRITEVHRNAVVEARRLKPTIPLIGYFGIPIVDEIELELLL